MTKTQKLRDKQIRQALTRACDAIKLQHSEFDFLTHSVDLKNEMRTLKVSCFFTDTQALNCAQEQPQCITDVIIEQLSAIKLSIKPTQISFSVK
ncbi:hypothetical protein J8L70_08915 [Pseudoalteromonas sp. MMG010]|uniref:hypothetical protein n=1 Tax=Pseudoalteromonas sp. MMG010 TaxID=2822685 RepID=UPI001B3A2068|nr:hypothetical protein [Pseudoalteromonas sp. MMG010]MBQ4833356.1 hypothetical protein [Pseudoalteromonas sp. MMG010]